MRQKLRNPDIKLTVTMVKDGGGAPEVLLSGRDMKAGQD